MIKYQYLMFLFGSALLFSCAQVINAPANAPNPAPAEFDQTGISENSIDRMRAPKDRPDKKTNTATWKRSQIAANTTKLMIGDDDFLPLKAVQANVKVEGFRARVVLDTYYFNDRNQSFEGTFKLRLPDGATPYFFAFGEMQVTADLNFSSPVFMPQQVAIELGSSPEEIMQARSDSWTAPKQARMVGKEKAAFAYGETVRVRVDPALMEWAGAGIFSARVFPLQPKKLHRIVIGYEMNLTHAGGDYFYQLDMPDAPQRVVDLAVAAFAAADPKDMLQLQPTAAWQEKTYGNGRPSLYYHRFENAQDRRIELRIRKPGPILLTEHDAKLALFAGQAQVALPRLANEGAHTDGVFLVDISLSSNPDKFNVYLQLLQQLLQANRGSMHRFAVLFFNIEHGWWREGMQENTPENVAALLRDAGRLPLQGATDVGAALDYVIQTGWLPANPATLFLLSDAAVTWGEYETGHLAVLVQKSKMPLFAYRTGLAGTDNAVLEALTKASNGAVFAATSEAELPQVAVAHRNRPWQIDSITINGADDILLAGRPTSLYPDQLLSFAGRGALQSGARLQIQLSRDSEKHRWSVTFAQPIRSHLAARAYGEMAVGQLENAAQFNRDIAAAFAEYFRVPGKTASLLMLESEQDYLRFGIKPEENLYVVKTTPVNDYLLQQDESHKPLQDNKAELLRWLGQLAATPGARIEIPAALPRLVQTLPSEYLSVQRNSLPTTGSTMLTAALRQSLSGESLSYDAVSEEAAGLNRNAHSQSALVLLSSLIETNPGDPVLMRDVAMTAAGWGYPGHAYFLFRRVADNRPFEPQTYRDMARALEEAGMADLAIIYYEVGLSGNWDPRYGEFRRIHGMDYLRFLKRLTKGELKSHAEEYTALRIKSITQEFNPGDADLVISIAWNTDNTDVDLHVREPNGETCNYKNNRTSNGGAITRDVTTGFGPELYTIAQADSGEYHVRVHYFGENSNRASTRTKVFATVFKHWGKDNEQVEYKTVLLEKNEELHNIVTVVFK